MAGGKTQREQILEEEMQRLMAFLEQARAEVAAIATAKDSSGADKNVNGLEAELSAITEATEEATNKIMDNAEAVMKLSNRAVDRYLGDNLVASASNIMEACSFQDITGQRVNKVISAISEVQKRVERLVELLGVDVSQTASTLQEDSRSDAELLAGPQLEGEGVSQDEVDAMLNGND